MRWFRRELDDFGPFDWDGLKPLFPRPVPEPWRDCPADLFLVPLTFVQVFADRKKLNEIVRTESEYITGLAEAINEQGLLVPPLMVFDSAGKVRYHDGYHRLAAIEILGYFNAIPVRLEHSPSVRGHGRPVSEEMPSLFQLFAVNADSTNRSSTKMTLQP